MCSAAEQQLPLAAELGWRNNGVPEGKNGVSQQTFSLASPRIRTSAASSWPCRLEASEAFPSVWLMTSAWREIQGP